MKLSKIITLILALVCMASLLASCGLVDLENSGKKPVTALEHYEYALNYSQSHPYKQTTVTETMLNGEPYTNTSVCNMDGDNYYMNEDGMTTTYYNGTVYVQSAVGKRKMVIDMKDFIYNLGESAGIAEDYWETLGGTLTDENMTLTKNDDGTSTLKFCITLPYVGTYDCVMTLDKDCRLTKYVMTQETTFMNTTAKVTDTTTYEYGDQYKVSPPADPDSYEVVTSYMDLVR